MGGGNANKTANARARKNAADAAAGSASSAESRKVQATANAAIMCKICMSTFPKTVRKPELEQHIESKHAKAKKTMEDCFPGYGQ